MHRVTSLARLLPALLFVFIAAYNDAAAQTVMCTFTPSNQVDTSLFSCAQTVTATIVYTNTGTDTLPITFTVPNTVYVVSSTPAATPLDNDNDGYYDLTFLTVGSDTITIECIPTSCNTFNDSIDILFPEIVLFACTYDSLGDTLVADYPNSALWSDGIHAYYLLEPVDFAIITGDPFLVNGIQYYSQLGTADQPPATIIREFAIRFTTLPQDIDSLLLSISAEADAQQLSLAVLDSSQSETFLTPVFGNTYNLTDSVLAFPSFLLVDDNDSTVYWLVFRQTVTLACTSATGPATVAAFVPCFACNDYAESAQATLNVVSESPSGSIAYAQSIAPAVLACSPDSTYAYTVAFTAQGSPFLLDSLRLPYNGLYFTVDSVSVSNDAASLTLDSAQFTDHTAAENSFMAMAFGAFAQAPPGLVDSVPDFALPMAPYYLPADSSFAVTLYLKFDCTGGLLQQCDSQFYSLAHTAGVLRYRTACAVLNGDTMWDNLEIDGVPGSDIDATLTGSFNPQDLTLDTAVIATFNMHYNGDNPFAISQGGLSLACDSVTFYAALTVPDYVAIDTIILVVGAYQIPVEATLDSTTHTFTIPYQHAIEAYNDSNALSLAFDAVEIHFTSWIALDTCPFSPATFGGFAYAMEMRAQCGDCAECYRVIKCLNVPVLVHCPGLCEGAVVHIEDVSLERTTFGWTDRDAYLVNDTLSNIDAAYYWANFPPDTADYELHKVYACDSIKVVAHGWTSDTADFTSISFELAYLPPSGPLNISNNVFSTGSAVFSFKSSNPLAPVFSDTLTAPTQLLIDTVLGMTGQMLILKYTVGPFSTASPVNQFEYDSLTFTAMLGINPPSGWPVGAHYIPQIRAQFSNTNNSSSFTQSCDPWGDDLTVLIPAHQTAGALPYPGCGNWTLNDDTVLIDNRSACIAKYALAIKTYGGFGPDVDDFPYEFRPYLLWPDSGWFSYDSNDYRLAEVLDLYSTDSANVVFDSTFAYDAAPHLRVVEKGDTALHGEQQGLLFLFQRRCLDVLSPIVTHIPIVHHAYARHLEGNACSDTVVLNAFTPTHYTCNGSQSSSMPAVPVVTTPNTTVNTLAATQDVSFTVSYSPPTLSQCDTIGLPNVWFDYLLTNGTDTLPVTFDVQSNTLMDVVPQTLGVGNYGFFQDTMTAAHVLQGGHVFKFHVNTSCVDTGDYVLTLRYGVMCDSAHFAAFLNADSSTIDSIVNLCMVCTRTVTVTRTDSVTLANDGLALDSCNHLVWEMNVVNLSADTIDPGQLLVHTPVGLAFDGMDSYASFAGLVTPQPYLPDSAGLVVWPYPSGNVLPSVTMWFETDTNTVAPGDTLHYRLSFLINCAIYENLPDMLYGLFIGFDPCHNLIDSAQVDTLLLSLQQAPAVCCDSAHYTLTMHQPCFSDTANFTLQVNDPVAGYVINLVDSTGTPLVSNAPVDSASTHSTPYSSPTLGIGSYGFTILDTTSFVVYTQTLHVLPIDSFAVSIEAYGVCGDSLYDSLEAVITGDSTATYAFQWNTGDTLAALDSVPPGIYTVTVTAENGCTLSVTDTLPTLSPDLAVIVDYTNACDAPGGLVTLIASGADSVWWTPSLTLDTLIGDTVHATPTQTTTYFVFGVDSNGCAGEDSLIVNVNCCLPLYGDIIPLAGDTVSQVAFLSSGVYATDSISVLGDLVVDTNLTISNTIVAVNSGKTIYVSSGDTLVLHNCLLFACEKMWQGIYVADGGYLIMDSTLLLDAEIGVEVDAWSAGPQGGASIRHSTFNKNYIGVQLNPGSPSNNVKIVASTFKCGNVTGYSPGPDLKAPHLGKAFKGIFLNEVNFQVGDPDTLSNLLRFDSLRYGVHSIHNRVQIFNCVFTHMLDTFSNTLTYGAGIWKQGGHLEVGGSYGPYAANSFDRCKYGVFAEATSVEPLSSLDVIGNSFRNLASQASQGSNNRSAATIVRLVKGTSIRFSKNSVKDAQTACGFYSNGLKVCALVVDSNAMLKTGQSVFVRFSDQYCKVRIFENEVNWGASGIGYSGYGIRVQNILPGYVDCQIYRNRIFKCKTGIDLRNVSKPQVFNTNQIEFPDGQVTGANAGDRYGIRADNCYGVNVQLNVIKKLGLVPDTMYRDTLVGIMIEHSTNSLVHENAVTRMGSAIGYIGSSTGGLNSPSIVRCNIMKDYIYGVRLQSAGIGTQGSSSDPADNKWDLPTVTPPGVFGVRGIVGTSFSNNDWWTRNTSARPFWVGSGSDMFPSGIASAFLVSSPPTYDCASEEIFPLAGMHEEYGKMVRNDEPYLLEWLSNEEDYMNKWLVYHDILEDSTFLEGIYESDLANFMDTFRYRTAGELEYIRYLLANGDTTTGNALSQLNMDYKPERNMRDVLLVYDETYARGVYEFDESQQAILDSIAKQSPMTGGEAVFYARVLLDMDYDDMVPDDFFGSRKERFETTELFFQLYPNPTDEAFVYTWKIDRCENASLKVYDVLGRLVLDRKVESELGRLIIDTSEWTEGVYTVNFSDGRRSLDVRKTIVLHR